MELNEGLIIAQRFRLVRELGRGGMGSVWLAHHTSLDVPCAVKFINAEAIDVPEIRARFEREAKAAASLRSPNVVNILDYGVSEVGPYIAMEFLDGEDLAHRLERRGRLGPQETVEIVGNVARALTRAHAAGLVHRDLKPENVFLVRDEDREIVKVLDFGIAKVNRLASTDGATKTGSLLGTPSYMSPEQAQGIKAVDHRSDLWSLAVVAFRCLTGRLPFVSEALGDLLMQIIVHPLPVPSAIAPDLSPAFDAWWARAAARDPAQRFQTAREEADALAAAFGLGAPLGGPSAFQPPVSSRNTPGPVGYATPPGAQPAAQAYGSGPYGAARAFAGPPSGPVTPPPGSGPTPLGVSHTFGAPTTATSPSGGRVAALVGGLAFLVGVLIVGGVLVTRVRGAGSPAPAASTSALPETTAALVAPPPPASASAVPSPVPAETAAPAAASASAAPPMPVSKPPARHVPSAKPVAPPTPSATPARRPRLVLPGSNDPSRGL